MKRGKILNAELSYAISMMGHTDLMVVCDATTTEVPGNDVTPSLLAVMVASPEPLATSLPLSGAVLLITALPGSSEFQTTEFVISGVVPSE